MIAAYVILQIPGAKNGKKVEVRAAAKFINECWERGFEFVAFLPGKNGLSKEIMFKRRAGEW